MAKSTASGRSPDDAPLEERFRSEDLSVGLAVRYTLRSFTRILQGLAAQHGLTAAEFRVLRTLSMAGTLTQAQLAALAGMDRPYASLIVKQLKAKELIAMERDEVDRRRTNLTLSPGGIAMTERVAAQLATVNGIAVDGVSTRDLKLFLRVMERVRANLDGIDPLQISAPVVP